MQVPASHTEREVVDLMALIVSFDDLIDSDFDAFDEPVYDVVRYSRLRDIDS